VPNISTFYGIAIYIYWSDHAPPHFHAIYGEYDGEIGIESLRLIDGTLPPRIRKLVLKWASMHRQELLDNWNLARKKQPLIPIAPLE
jgi:hypothetical protein